jgi:hypothetical protein
MVQVEVPFYRELRMFLDRVFAGGGWRGIGFSWAFLHSYTVNSKPTLFLARSSIILTAIHLSRRGHSARDHMNMYICILHPPVFVKQHLFVLSQLPRR